MSGLEAASLVDVVLRRGLVLTDKVVLAVASKPNVELANLLPESRNGLLIHVGLRQELREGHCAKISQSLIVFEGKSVSRTNQTSEMLGAVDITDRLRRRVGLCILPHFAEVHELVTLESEHSLAMRFLLTGRERNVPVQENPAQSLLKVLTESGNDFFEDIHAGGSFFSVGSLVGQIVVQNLAHWLRVRKGDELVVLGDILPVVYQHSLNVVGYRDIDHGLVVKGVLLPKS